MHPEEFGLLPVGELGLPALEPATGAGDGHALTGAHLEQVGFELGEDASMLKNILDIGSPGS
ncbi:hypothetical protein [Nonomuraea pusilla]|uniref:hypothetical protein n=1 Tax=Nonomuraea pusilla TaxID=46177 RepID=UPI002109E2DD|nr:hypothetical protein [Nonomuraea pusilla]